MYMYCIVQSPIHLNKKLHTVMATSSKPVGHECEFVDQVPEDYFCQQCSHVAREPQIASCCTEVFCKACIEAVIEDKQPCPSCESTDISSLGPHKKYQPKILALKVHCSLKDCGCEWAGQLQHLDAHLDLTTGDCVYVDVDCPSKCNQKVKKRNVDTHLANHCPNRDYTCPHCSFKATFREVSEHFEVCRYYPLVCPNRCGASFERDVLEDHMKMCGLQKVQCEFSYTGCGAEFIRDDQKEHMEQNTQKHLALVAATTLRISQTFEQKLQEQQRAFDQKFEEKDKHIRMMLEEQKVFEKKLEEQQKEFHKQQRMLEEKLEEKDHQIKMLREQQNRLHIKVGILPYHIILTKFQDKKAKNLAFRSPSVYTRFTGYKFELSLRPNGPLSHTVGHGTHVAVFVYSVKGDHDDILKFPARFTITLELLNQHRDQDHHRRHIQCEVTRERIGNKHNSCIGSDSIFILHLFLEWDACKQTQYLKNDCLKFRITEIVVHE